MAHPSVLCEFCGCSWGHYVIMPRAWYAQHWMLCVPRLQQTKREEESFGHIYPVVRAVEEQLPQLVKTEHDGVLRNQHRCRLASIMSMLNGRVHTLVGKVVKKDPPPSHVLCSSSPALVRLAFVALQPTTQPHDRQGDRALNALDTTSGCDPVDDMCVDLILAHPIGPSHRPHVGCRRFLPPHRRPSRCRLLPPPLV